MAGLAFEAVQAVGREDHPALSVGADHGGLLVHPALLADLADLDHLPAEARRAAGCEQAKFDSRFVSPLLATGQLCEKRKDTDPQQNPRGFFWGGEAGSDK